MDLLLPRHWRADKEGIATRWLVDLREEHRRQLAPKPIRCAMARTPGARRIAAYAADQNNAACVTLASCHSQCDGRGDQPVAARISQSVAQRAPATGQEGLARTAPRVRHSSPCERCKKRPRHTISEAFLIGNMKTSSTFSDTIQRATGGLAVWVPIWRSNWL